MNSSTFDIFSNDTGKKLRRGLNGASLNQFLKSHCKEQSKKHQEYTVIENHRPVVKQLGKFKTKHTVSCTNGKLSWGKRLYVND